MIATLAFAVSGCNKEAHPLEAHDEGARVYVDGLYYQVQLSRPLNPKDVEDSTYLLDQKEPTKGNAYFGVFLRVDNETTDRRVLPSGTDAMKITTASGNVFKPIPVKAAGWGWEPAPIGKGAMLPIPNTPAYIGPVRGGLILFYIPQADLDDRPLVLSIKGSDGRVGKITVDV